jgi:rhodanese-related sulfurtransferase
MADLTQDQWVAQLAADDNAVILDVRTADEVSEGFIPNAIHIDFHLGQGFVDGVNALDKTKKLLCLLPIRRKKRAGLCRNDADVSFRNSS